MTKLDILFVNANSSVINYQELALKFSSIETPIWAGMLANAVRTKGFATAILDCEAERLDTIDSAGAALDAQAKLICFVVYGQNPNDGSPRMEGATATAKLIKQMSPNQKILFVGPHMAALPRETLAREECMDFLCQNEGTYTILNLLQVQNLNDETQLAKVKGLAFRSKNFKKKSLLSLAEESLALDMNIVLNEPEEIVPRNMLEVDLPGIA